MSRGPSKLRVYRQRAGLKPHRVAKRFGVLASTVNEWERGACAPPIYKLALLAELYGMTAQEVGEVVLEWGALRRG